MDKMLDRNAIANYIELHLSIPATKTKNLYAREYKMVSNKPTSTIYLEQKTEIERLIIHPSWEPSLIKNSIEGICLLPNRKGGHSLDNSNFTEFPRLVREGTRSGCAVALRDVAALDALLVRIGALQASKLDETTAFTDIEAAALQLAELPETEREAVTAARIGQGRFRTALMSVWSNRCAVTRIDVEGLLRASHIKPWRDSDNEERLDAENGLLLVATLDAAFDAGLISFEDDGLMIFSPRLRSDPCTVLGVPAGCRLTRGPSSRQQAFLRHHRNHVFPHGPPRGEPPRV